MSVRIPHKFLLCCLFALAQPSVPSLKAQDKQQLRGLICDEHGKAIEKAGVTLQPDNRRAITDARGRFLIKALYEGDYTLTASALGFEPEQITISIGAGRPNEVKMSLRTSSRQLSEVKVAGVHGNPDNFIDMTKTAMPSKVISREEIEMMGSRRLDEVLKEQTGLAIVNDIGSGSRAVGLQMQGFDSGYTMVMIDGQPMVGRNNGNFDLSRVTVSNIERIEIIKGASSCLFGSEALAGVVNIVTRKHISRPQAMAALKYGSFNMTDLTLEGESPFADKKGSAYLSANYYRTDGFNSNPYLSEGKTAPPFNSYSAQGRMRYVLSDVSSVNLNGRLVTRHSENRLAYQGVKPSVDVLNEFDLNGSIALNNNFSNGLRLKSQYYLTRYENKQGVTDLESGLVMPGSDFRQYLHRAELQADRQLTAVLGLTGGAGAAYELLDNDFYQGNKSMSNYFVYGQAQWQAAERLSVTAGARYDYHDKYGSKLNPSLGLRFAAGHNMNVKAAIGTGFKTPNFQQLYMVFTNIQTGYSVFGAEEFWREMGRLQEGGQIMSVFPMAQRVGQLKPERSVSYSGGFEYKPLASLGLYINLFYNDMRNFINYEQVALKTSGQQIYSYMNIAKAYTAGAELGGNWRASRSLSLSAGYQLLYAVDRGVVDSIRNGTGLYGQTYDVLSNRMRASRRSDYVGMNNRSRHMANLKATYIYDRLGLTGAVRLSYRSRYGFMEDNRANNFLDRWDRFVAGYFLFNVSVQKTFYGKHLQLQLTADNIMDYRDQLMPAQQGRAVLAGLSWRFFKDE
ncbi:TonB-dependent receptor [Pedobacter faecalis]|uniref:TonB-dependent receptor n=1 Tax=Pedobacter faecalis TaxID=3041495 RepID=UPI00254D144B|nr:TonB-dependent receptor [Pedobacter sp. ELA7]